MQIEDITPYDYNNYDFVDDVPRVNNNSEDVEMFTITVDDAEKKSDNCIQSRESR